MFPHFLLIVQALSSKYEMRASHFEQSVEIGGEGYFYVPNMIGWGPQKKNDRFAVYAAYLQHISQKCCII